MQDGNFKRFENISSLENAGYGLFSGMAAITALFQTMNKGDHALISRNVYGGTYRVATIIG